jgi:hypothetical protein
MFRRCIPQVHSYLDRSDGSRQTKDKAKSIIAAEIELWTWKLPTTGKALSECTFQEIAEAAPLSGRFLSKLATQGAPGSLVREVFTKAELQGFWSGAQGASVD